MIPDLINGAFELLGGFVIILSIMQLHCDKIVKGVSWKHVAFFSAWGWWNIFYYPYLGQWASFAGGLFIVIFNTIWFAQMLYYLRK